MCKVQYNAWIYISHIHVCNMVQNEYSNAVTLCYLPFYRTSDI